MGVYIISPRHYNSGGECFNNWKPLRIQHWIPVCLYWWDTLGSREVNHDPFQGKYGAKEETQKTDLIFLVPYLRSAVNLLMFLLVLNSEHGNTNQDLHTGLTFQVIFNGPGTHYYFHTVHNVVIVLSTNVPSGQHCMYKTTPIPHLSQSSALASIALSTFFYFLCLSP